MKLSVRILLSVLCAALVLSMPFVLSAPNLLPDAKWKIMEELEGEDYGFLKLLVPAARAEDDGESEPEDEAPEYSLPIDFSAGYEPNPACFTADSYEDASIRVEMETRVIDGETYRIAWVEIASPTQLRTAVAGGSNVNSTKEAKVIDMAKKNQAIVAINGDYYQKQTTKKAFEYRMGVIARKNTNQMKDILIIDENGDFHIVLAQATADQLAALQAIEKEYAIINAFCFGPALVKDGELIQTSKNYDWAPNGKTARTAIGQLGKLQYVLVAVDGKENPVRGATHQQLADFMYEIGCQNAYNLDGGGSSYLFFHDDYYNIKMAGHRDITDIIYFATAVSPEE